MIEITIPEQNRKIIGQVKQVFGMSQNGLVMVTSNDQDWVEYVARGVVSGLSEAISDSDRAKKIVSINEDDKDYFPWMKWVSAGKAEIAGLVFAGNVRSAELMKDVFSLAQKTKVVGVSFVPTAATLVERFQDMGISKEDIDKNLLAVIQQGE